MKGIGLLKRRGWLLLGILIVGIFLRAFQFPANPPGLFVDEVTAGYETWSLLKTGADRWGVHLPVYFINWGAGQNVLYSYLSIPFVSLFGLSRFSVRLASLFLGILMLPLAYVTVRRRLGEDAALVSTALLAILPWHVMISRWSLESNILPFFLLLGIYTMTRALDSGSSRLWIVLALVPWGFTFYAYALSLIVVPIMLALIVLFYRKTILANWKTWLVSAGVFAVIAFPMSLFLFKNFVFHDTLAIERFLPFGIPLPPTTRFSYVSSPIPERWVSNFFFLLSGFQEGENRNALVGSAPLFLVFLPLGLVGVADWVRSKQSELFLLWLFASLPILLLVDGGVARFNSIILPLLVASAWGVIKLSNALRSALSRKILVVGVGALVAIQALVFTFDYFFVFPTDPDYELAYVKNMDRAISTGVAMAAPSEPILLSSGMELSYIFAAFYTDYPPGQFQHEVKYTTEHGLYDVISFGRFYVNANRLPEGSFAYVLGKWDQDPCANPKRFWESRLWKVGQCESR